LLSLPNAVHTLNPRTLFEHLTFQNHFGDKTLVQGIQLLPAGHWAMLNADTGEFRSHLYWEPVFQDGPWNPAQAAGLTMELRERVERAVERQLVGDVPIGRVVSGGMDTGACTAGAARRRPGGNTATFGFARAQ